MATRKQFDIQRLANPTQAGIGPYPQVIDDESWIQNGVTAILNEIVTPETYINIIENCILESFGQIGYEESLPAIVTAKTALDNQVVLSGFQVRQTLADLLTGLRQAFSQAGG